MPLAALDFPVIHREFGIFICQACSADFTSIFRNKDQSNFLECFFPKQTPVTSDLQ
jgi:hypothetical protein